MGITLVTEMWSADETTGHSEDGINYTINSRRALDISVDDPANWNSLLIGGALSDPMLRGSYPSDFFLRCDDLQIQRLTPYLFRTTAGYLGKQGNPLDQPPQIYWGSTVTEEEIDVDMDGNPIIMVTGEGFDPPVREPVYDRILRITRNIADYNDNWATLFRNATNANQFGSFPPGTALCRSLDASTVNDSDFQYWTCTGEFQIRDAPPGSDPSKAWYRRLLARGYYVTAFSGSVIARGLTRPGGQPSETPVLHNVTTGAQIFNNADTQWYYFRTKNSVDFNQIGLW